MVRATHYCTHCGAEIQTDYEGSLPRTIKVGNTVITVGTSEVPLWLIHKCSDTTSGIALCRYFTEDRGRV